MRLGEFDTRITSDGEHQDIAVVDEEPHEDFSMKWQINDIAIVYLERDVVFNGKLTEIFNLKMDQLCKFILHHRSHTAYMFTNHS